MTTIAKLAAVTLATLLLTTSLASAGDIHFPGVGDSDSDEPSDFLDYLDETDEGDGEVPGFPGPYNAPVIDVGDGLIQDPPNTPGPNPAPPAVLRLNNEAVNDVLLGRDITVKQALKQGYVVLDCSVDTTELLIANAGVIGIPAGTKLKWSIKSYGAQGYVQLKADLLAGKTIRVADVLEGQAKAGTNCAVGVTGL